MGAVPSSTSAPFPTVRSAALALLTAGVELRQKEGQFLGGIAYADNPLTPKQDNWLAVLLRRHGLPPLAEGVA